jgi:hypothetical protein
MIFVILLLINGGFMKKLSEDEQLLAAEKVRKEMIDAKENILARGVNCLESYSNIINIPKMTSNHIYPAKGDIPLKIISIDEHYDGNVGTVEFKTDAEDCKLCLRFSGNGNIIMQNTSNLIRVPRKLDKKYSRANATIKDFEIRYNVLENNFYIPHYFIGPNSNNNFSAKSGKILMDWYKGQLCLTHEDMIIEEDLETEDKLVGIKKSRKENGQSSLEIRLGIDKNNQFRKYLTIIITNYEKNLKYDKILNTYEIRIIDDKIANACLRNSNDTCTNLLNSHLVIPILLNPDNLDIDLTEREKELLNNIVEYIESMVSNEISLVNLDVSPVFGELNEIIQELNEVNKDIPLNGLNNRIDYLINHLKNINIKDNFYLDTSNKKLSLN